VAHSIEPRSAIPEAGEQAEARQAEERQGGAMTHEERKLILLRLYDKGILPLKDEVFEVCDEAFLRKLTAPELAVLKEEMREDQEYWLKVGIALLRTRPKDKSPIVRLKHWIQLTRWRYQYSRLKEGRAGK
jgi:hypothetical protein